MDWPRFVRALAALNTPPTDDDLLAALAAAAETPEEREQIEDATSARDLLAYELNPPLRDLISVSWTGAYSSRVALQVLDAGGCGLLVRRDDTVPETDWIVLAVIPERVTRASLQKALSTILVQQLVSENASPPDHVALCCPELLPRATARAWWRWRGAA